MTTSPGPHVVPLVLLLGAAALLACGEPTTVGRACAAGQIAPGQVSVTSPSLDCESRMCLAVGDGPAPTLEPGYCTALCSEDDECEQVIDARCESGFTCAVAMETGPFSCQSMCVCRDDLGLLPVQPVPASCGADDDGAGGLP